MTTLAPQPVPGDAAAGSTFEPTVHHVPLRRKRRVTSSRMSVNLGPMIDVIFNLLIYFVVTANFAIDEGVLTLKLPQHADTPQDTLSPPEQPLEIVLRSIETRTGPGVVIMLQNRQFNGTFGDLGATLAALQFTPQNPSGLYKPDNPVLIRPEGEVRWQHVVDAFNATIAARYTNVSFAQSQGGLP